MYIYKVVDSNSKDIDTEDDSTSPDVEEVAEEALCLVNHEEDKEEKETPEPEPEGEGATRAKAGKWKGFSFKKQLSRVDLNLKNTFSNAPNSNTSNNNNNHVNKTTCPESDTEVPENPPDSDENVISENSSEPVKKCTRPTQLELFDRAPKKRVSLIEKNQQPTTRDTRLLSVPNISFRKPRHTRNSQFSNLMRKISKYESPCFLSISCGGRYYNVDG